MGLRIAIRLVSVERMGGGLLGEEKWGGNVERTPPSGLMMLQALLRLGKRSCWGGCIAGIRSAR